MVVSTLTLSTINCRRTSSREPANSLINFCKKKKKAVSRVTLYVNGNIFECFMVSVV